jgi:hypothetical protein
MAWQEIVVWTLRRLHRCFTARAFIIWRTGDVVKSAGA